MFASFLLAGIATGQICRHPPQQGPAGTRHPFEGFDPYYYINSPHRLLFSTAVFISKRPEVLNLQGKLHYLSFLNIQECGRRGEVSEAINLQQRETTSIAH